MSVDWSPDRARRALYIDFEGTMTEPASFLGIACEGVWEAVIVEQALWSAATHGVRCGSVRFGQIHDVLTELRQKSEVEHRSVVAWSTRELEEIQAVLPQTGSEAKWWQTNLINALPIAKRWARLHSIQIREIPSSHGGRPNRHSLAGFMEAVGFEVPSTFGPGNSAQRIRHVRNQLAKRGSFESLTRTSKGKWSRGLQHNRYDCLGLAAVMEAVAQSL